MKSQSQENLIDSSADRLAHIDADLTLPNEISSTLEMVKRIKAVNNAHEANAASSQGAFSYSLPQPVYLCQAIN